MNKNTTIKRKALNEHSSQYMDSFESPQEDYTKSSEFKIQFYRILSRYLKERVYIIVTERINGTSFEELADMFCMTPQRVRKIYNDAIKEISQHPYLKEKMSALLRGDYILPKQPKPYTHINPEVQKWKQMQHQKEIEYRDKHILPRLLKDPWFQQLRGRNYEEAKVYAYRKYGIKLESKNRNVVNKKLIRLTESDIHKIIKESVKRIIKESDSTMSDFYWDDSDVVEANLHYATYYPEYDDIEFDERDYENGIPFVIEPVLDMHFDDWDEKMIDDITWGVEYYGGEENKKKYAAYEEKIDDFMERNKKSLIDDIRNNFELPI